MEKVFIKLENRLLRVLTVDFFEDVKIAVETNQMVTAALSGHSLKLNYCGLDKAIALLKEQYGGSKNSVA